MSEAGTQGAAKRIIPVSLVLTTLNEERTLPDFLQALATQSVRPREMVVCDGGSTDATMRLLEEFRLDGTAVVAFCVAGANIARGRNAAIARASCDIIAVTDAGCIPRQDWLEAITALFFVDAATLAVGGGYALDARTRFERIARAAEMRIADIPADEFLPSSRSFAVRKSAWAAVGGYPEHLSFAGEDTDFCLRLRRAGCAIVLQLDAVVAWRPRPTLASYVRQHMLYGIGDGEAGNKAGFYQKIFVKHALFLGLMLAGLLHPAFLALFCAVLLLYFFRLFHLYRWREITPVVAAAAFALIGAKELALFAGYVRGIWTRHSDGVAL